MLACWETQMSVCVILMEDMNELLDPSLRTSK